MQILLDRNVGLSFDIKAKRWSLITAITITAILFLGRIEGFNVLVYRVMTPLFLLLSFYYWKPSLKKLPKEFFVWVILLVWSLFGLPIVRNSNLFWDNFFYIVQSLILLVAVVLTVLYTGSLKPMLAGFIASAFLHLGQAVLESGLSLSSVTRLEGLTGNSNGFAFRMLLAIFSILLLWKKINKNWQLILAFASFFILSYAIVATASRKSFVALLIVFALWLLVTFKDKFKSIFLLAIPMALGGVFLYFITEKVFENTNLGYRFKAIENIEDQNRYFLYLDGIDMIERSPFLGVGLGNYKAHSQLGKIAHSDLLEITSDLGIIGLFIYLTIYYIFVKKVLYLLRFSRNKEVVYQMKIILIVVFIYFIIGLGRPHFIDIISTLFLSSMIAYTHFLTLRHKTGLH